MKRFLTYISEARAELFKVNWPSRRDATTMTFLVIGFTLVFASFIGAVDYLFSMGLQRLIIKG